MAHQGLQGFQHDLRFRRFHDSIVMSTSHCVLLLLCLVGGTVARQVAVIGAGVAGASAAHYLRRELPDVEITV